MNKKVFGTGIGGSSVKYGIVDQDGTISGSGASHDLRHEKKEK